jgi:transcriptional regulator with XRE-family HTH domain
MPTESPNLIATSQTEIARRVGVRQHVVNRWMRGVHFPRRYHLHAIAAILGVPVEQVAQDMAVRYALYHDPKK